MEHRWNHDIPNEYFLDPRYNSPYAPSLNRQDSELSNGSARSTDSYYSSYSARSQNNQVPTYQEPLQATVGFGHHNHYSASHSAPSSSSRNRRATASTRSGSTSSSSTYSNRERFYCEHSDCYNGQGEPSSFSRRADLNRHYQSVHGTVLHSCPWPRCERRGDRGFPRLDHLMEHRRGYHHEDIPKRETGRDPWR